MLSTLRLWAASTAALTLFSVSAPVMGADLEQLAPGESHPNFALNVNALALGEVERTDGFVVDADDTVFDSGSAASGLFRFGAEGQTVLRLGVPLIFHTEAEADMASGNLVGAASLAGADFPLASEAKSLRVRKAFARLSIGRFLHLGGGLTTSQWGLGLLANDGSTTWQPKTATFVRPGRGDVVLRGLAATGPFTDLGVTAYVFTDGVQDDDVLRDGDTARQFGGGVKLGDDAGTHGGIYLVRRSQEALDGDTTDVDAVDLAAVLPIALPNTSSLTLGFEGAFIRGTTDLGPTFEHRDHDVRQFGAAFRAKLDAGRVGGVLDVLWLSGDQNFDDGQLNGFKADRNYESGMLLFKQVLAAQTARAPFTASNPDLVGIPSEDLDRLPTDGSPTNTVSFFPRVYWQPTEGLEVFGGPLIALSEVSLADPFNTRVNGGEPTNALGGAPSGVLGTELDLGVRGRTELAGQVELTAGFDGALLVPGGAFDDAGGQPMDPVFGGRTSVELTF